MCATKSEGTWRSLALPMVLLGVAGCGLPASGQDDTIRGQRTSQAIVPLPPGGGVGPLVVQQARLAAAVGAAGDKFGNAVAVEGDTVLVGAPGHAVAGAPAGAAYVFARRGSDWIQEALLVAPDGADGDGFGVSVALSGDRLLVGAHQADGEGRRWQGAAYVFARAAGAWTFEAKLVAGDGSSFDQLGTAVALLGDTALVGAPFRDGARGAVYAFSRDGQSWTERQVLVPQDESTDHFFGASVALDASRAVVGASWPTEGSGSVHLFARSSNTWTEEAELTADETDPPASFGLGVAVSGDTILVGAPSHDDLGSAFVFFRGSGGWRRQQRLQADGGVSGDGFGISVALQGDTALIGGGDGVGASLSADPAYVFSRAGARWDQVYRLTASDVGSEDGFGAAVALDADTMVIGARLDAGAAADDLGSAFVFTIRHPEMIRQQRLLHDQQPTPDEVASLDYLRDFGWHVAISGDTAVIGVENGAHVFQRTGSTWTLQQTIDLVGPTLLYVPVAIDRDTIVVGAPNVGAGTVYVFVRAPAVADVPTPSARAAGSAWRQEAALVVPGSDFHANDVAIDGDTIVVGVGANWLGDAGAAYVFERTAGEWGDPQELTDPTGFPSTDLGWSVAVGGDLAAVSDPNRTPTAGVVHVFRRDGASWAHDRTFTEADVPPPGTLLGFSIAISGDTLAASGSSEAVLWQRTGTGWSAPDQLPIDCDYSPFYRPTVAVDGPLAVVGCNNDNSGSGSAHVFANDGLAWNRLPPLVLTGPGEFTLFGNSVDVSGDTVVIGAPCSRPGGLRNAGTAHVFVPVACETVAPAAAGDLPEALAGVPYDVALDQATASGDRARSYAVSSGSLPPGLALATDTGVVSGTPTAVGGYDFVITATDLHLCPSKRRYTLVVACPEIAVAPETLPGARSGDAYSQTITAGSMSWTADFTFTMSSGSLPPGLQLSQAGRIAGTPTVAGSYRLTVEATGPFGCGGERAYVLDVACPDISFDPPRLPPGVVAAPYDQALTAAGGTAPYQFRIGSGALPPGLALSSQGTLSGTPASFGEFYFQIEAADAQACSAARLYSLRISR